MTHSTLAAPAAPIAKPPSPWREALRVFCRNPSSIFGLVLLLAIVAVAVFGPMLMDVDPFDLVAPPMDPPGSEFAILGSDYLGRDVLTGLIFGGRATLLVGIVAAFLSVFIGVVIGALAGYYGGWVDEVLMRITEFFQVLPALLFAMVLVTLFSPTLWTSAIAIGVVSWTSTARLARGEFLRLKQLDYVLAERVIGAGSGRIIWKVILPNAVAPLIVSATLAVGTAILFEAGLSFLGLGDPNMMSWGLMIGSSRPYILDAWWAVTLPGVAIFLTVLAVSLIGDGLNDAFNPRLRERA
ncbi:ABC transporter permease [uncultured Castellaniella sp.]|uniref:ABC transporter permease n=1 Tax=uncultured Castellaniella sp. TaxID=647907 RepID=UPI002604E9F6|nr:ABC transporter permease [uncultured Castellaniella sp.]